MAIPPFEDLSNDQLVDLYKKTYFDFEGVEIAVQRSRGWFTVRGTGFRGKELYQKIVRMQANMGTKKGERLLNEYVQKRSFDACSFVRITETLGLQHYNAKIEFNRVEGKTYQPNYVSSLYIEILSSLSRSNNQWSDTEICYNGRRTYALTTEEFRKINDLTGIAIRMAKSWELHHKPIFLLSDHEH